MRARGRGRRLVAWPAVALIVLGAGCADPPTVENVKVANETDYPADVSVSDGDRDGWLSLGLVPAGQTKSFNSVLDQGKEWTFRFEYFEEHPVETVVSRADLERDDWRLPVPGSFAGALEEEGVHPPP
jgi:hypothetical protein